MNLISTKLFYLFFFFFIEWRDYEVLESERGEELWAIQAGSQVVHSRKGGAHNIVLPLSALEEVDSSIFPTGTQ